MKSKKVEVFEFDPQIYPIKFWILIKPTRDTIDKTFIAIDDKRFNINDDCFNKDLTNAFILNKPVKYLSTGEYGFILCINNLDHIFPKTMAHEATHLAGYTWIHLSEYEIGSETEANAYLVGWFTDCIDQVITKLKK